MLTVDYVTLTRPRDSLLLNATSCTASRQGIVARRLAGKLPIWYHMDKYFVPENTGLQLEELARKGDLLAKVNVFNGYALLVDIVPRR